MNKNKAFEKSESQIYKNAIIVTNSVSNNTDQCLKIYGIV